MNSTTEQTGHFLAYGPSIYYIRKGLGGWFQKCFFLTFSSVLFMLISHLYLVGGSGKLQKCADVIMDGPLLLPLLVGYQYNLDTIKLVAVEK